VLGGIRPGDQILSVNGIEFGGKSLEYVVEQMELLMENETIVILFFE
jgi:C-terminal processing protease CtpA/Prc